MRYITTLSLTLLMATGCIALHEDDLMEDETTAVDEVGQAGDSLTRKMLSVNGDACSVTHDGGTHDGTMQGNMCCYLQGGLEQCYNCLNDEIDCTSPRGFGAGGFGRVLDTETPF